MKLIEEVVDYCLARGMLDETQLLRLQEMGLGCWVYYDYEDYCDDCEALWEKARVEADERLMEIEKLAQVGEEERVLMERVERHSNARMAARRKAGGGSRPVRKKTTAPELDALLAPLLDAMFDDDALSRCVVKLGARAGIKETSNVRDAASSLARLSESELLTALTQALDANGRDRLSLNDVYAAILAWPDLTFLKERGGPAVDACRTLLREDYESGVASRDAWLLGESDAVRDLYWYQRFKLGLIAALRTVYKTDRATFKRWSTDGGRLPFPRWDEANKTNTTCWRVWVAVDQTPREVLSGEWWALLHLRNDTETMALRHVLTDLWGRDWSHLTHVDGDCETFEYVSCRLDYDEQPPLFPAIQSVDVGRTTNWIRIQHLKSLPNLKTLTLRDFYIGSDEWSSLAGCANLQALTLNDLHGVTDAGLSSLAGCANLQMLELNRLNGVTDAGLSSLSGCANLQTLELNRLHGITDAGLSSLSGCANLQALTLGSLNNVTDAGLSSLLNLPNLRQIKASNCGFNDGCSFEITLDAEGNRRFDGTFASDFVLKAFAAQLANDSFVLAGDAITDAGLSSLSGCANLQTLELNRLNGVTDAGLSSLSGCANLQTLRLLSLGDVTDAGLSSLAGCANLQTLELRSLEKVTDAGLSSLSGCANLRTLEIWRCDGVTDDVLTKLTALKGLRSLSLNRCGGFTGVGVAALGAASNLRSLEFWKCGGASSADVDALRKRLPNCEIRFTPRD